METSSFLCHVRDVSKREAAEAIAESDVDVVVVEVPTDASCKLRSSCTALWHQGKAALAQINHSNPSNDYIDKETQKGIGSAEHALMSQPWRMSQENILSGCACLETEACAFCCVRIKQELVFQILLLD